MRQKSLHQETLESIARWEKKTKVSGLETKSMRSESTVVGSLSGWKSVNESIKSTDSRDSVLTMGALEYVLDHNPAPLQEFSALREFSGENIAFLTSVAEWKHALPEVLKEKDGGDLTKDGAESKDLIREHFNAALHIYAQFISVRYAEFPLNISFQTIKKLAIIFDEPAQRIYGSEPKANSATPFAEPEKSVFDLSSPTSEGGFSAANRSTDTIVPYLGDIPEAFSATIFDEAEASIKYLVLTNTWPKFIKDRRISVNSLEALQSGTEAA